MAEIVLTTYLEFKTIKGTPFVKLGFDCITVRTKTCIHPLPIYTHLNSDTI